MTDVYPLQTSDDFTDMIDDENRYVPEYYPDEEEFIEENDDQQSATSEQSQEFTKTNKRNKNKRPKKKKQPQNDIPGYRKIKDKDRVFEYFSTTPFSGSKIRDPIHGRLYDNHIVGSKDEDLYYKVVYVGNGAKEPDHLYYDNPEQCESHMDCTINIGNKNEWAEKYQFALRRLENTR